MSTTITLPQTGTWVIDPSHSSLEFVAKHLVVSKVRGRFKAAFSASTTIDREAFGITWNAALETGGVLVGKTVKIELDVQLARKG